MEGLIGATNTGWWKGEVAKEIAVCMSMIPALGKLRPGIQ
jgi:hypothetical protein